MPERLAFVVRTPERVVIERALDSVRLPAQSGHFGLRPRAEPLITAIESGLVLMHAGPETDLCATAGGLLEHTGASATLYTPFATTGARDEVLAALEQLRETPDVELAARRELGELEQRIVHELGRGPREVTRDEPGSR